MTFKILTSVVGPRVPRREWTSRPLRYALPNAFLLAAGILLIVSATQPYWLMTLKAPQYPHGLHVIGYVNHLEGDVAELNGLNHYIGMQPLDEAATFEKKIGVASLWAFSILLLGGAVVHRRWAVLLVLPALTFPAAFLLDLHFWLQYCGHHLNPHAPLSSAIKPFTPPVLGIGKIGQFRTFAGAGIGLILAYWSSGLIFAGLVFHRFAYKPLAENPSTEGQP